MKLSTNNCLCSVDFSRFVVHKTARRTNHISQFDPRQSYDFSENSGMGHLKLLCMTYHFCRFWSASNHRDSPGLLTLLISAGMPKPDTRDPRPCSDDRASLHPLSLDASGDSWRTNTEEGMRTCSTLGFLRFWGVTTSQAASRASEWPRLLRESIWWPGCWNHRSFTARLAFATSSSSRTGASCR